MNKTSLAFISLIIGSSVFLTACESEEENLVGQAMACLNDNKTNSETQSKTCYDLVAGIQSTDASYIRCLSIFNMRGKFTTEFVDAFDALEDSSATYNQNVEMMAIVGFSGVDGETGNAASDDATEALNECSNSGSRGFTLLAGMSSMASVIGGLTAAAIDGNLAGADAEELGAAANTTYSIYCEGVENPDPFCDEFEAAGAVSTDNTTLGNALKTALDN